MTCFRDITFCVQWEICAKGKGCEYALTEEVGRRAQEAGLPISQVDRRECFKPYSKSIERRLNTREVERKFDEVKARRISNLRKDMRP